MTTISTEVRMTMVRMSPLVAAAAYGILPGHPSTWPDRARFGDVNDAIIDTAGRRAPFISRGNRHARRAAAVRSRRS